mmetsp:Transcript_7417/g.14897  ORF Transcript_7417/g.14897 Transcript_7417/m.14897 type:complete len:108 (+) Transcript_7417:2263-2586(+)
MKFCLSGSSPGIKQVKSSRFQNQIVMGLQILPTGAKNVPLDTSEANVLVLAEMAVATAEIIIVGGIHKIKHGENPMLTEKDFSRGTRPFFSEHRAYIGSELASLSCS